MIDLLAPPENIGVAAA
jgi:kinesin family member 6/9